MKQGQPITLSELATVVNGQVAGDPHLVITGVGSLEQTGPGEIVLAEDERKLCQALKQSPSALLLLPVLAEKAQGKVKGMILVQNPRLAFARILAHFAPLYPLAPGIHPTAVISPEASLGRDVRIHAYAVVEAGAKIGDRTWIYPGVYVGPDVTIGADCVIYPNVVLRERVTVGSRVIIHPGAVIGADGFGFTTADGVHHKVPQIGTVEIQDDVEIGANTCIDRATIGKTVIGRGTKLDNLIQIGHNVQLGQGNLMAGLSGVAGSAKTGDYVTVGGQSGIVGHITVASGTVLAGASVIAGNITEPGFLSGVPARPHREEMRAKAAARKLPEVIKNEKELERRIAKLEEMVARLSAEAR